MQMSLIPEFLPLHKEEINSIHLKNVLSAFFNTEEYPSNVP